MKAENGADALENARQSPPDLIVSDILIPIMDGYALCHRCKTDDRLHSVPFVFYTATYTQQEDQALGLDLGADRFLLKPQEPEVLIGIFQELLNKKRREASPVLASLEEEMEFLRRHNEALGRKLEKKILDLEAVYEQLRTQEETLRKEDEFLARVIENIPDMIFVKDAKTLNFVRFNRAGEKLLGVRREDMIGKNDYDFFPREQVDFFTAKDRETLAGKKLVDIRDESIETRDLGTRILHTKKIPILDEKVGSALSSGDIGGRHRA